MSVPQRISEYKHDTSKIFCCLSSPSYTKAQLPKAPCTSSIANGDYFTCCIDCNGVTKYCCFKCSTNVSKMMNNEIIKWKKKGYKPVITDATQLLCVTNWQDIQKNYKQLIDIGGERKVMNLIQHPHNNKIYHYYDDCPLCQDMRHSPQPTPPITNVKPPSVDIFNLINIKTTQINRVTGAYEEAYTSVEVVLCKTIMNEEEEKKFTHLLMEEGQGNAMIFHSRPKGLPNKNNNLVYRLIAKEERGGNGTYTAISVMPFGGGNKVDKATMRELGEIVTRSSSVPLGSTRDKMKESTPDNDILSGKGKEIHNMPGGYRNARRRGNRSNGANANCNGKYMGDLKLAKSSPQLIGVHCRTSNVTYMLAFENEATGVVDKLICIYAAATTKNEFTFAHNSLAPAVKSCEAGGSTLVGDILDINDEGKRKRMIKALSNFQLARVDIALLCLSIVNESELRDRRVMSISNSTSLAILTTWAQTKRWAAEANSDVTTEQHTEVDDDYDVNRIDDVQIFRDNPPHEELEPVMVTLNPGVGNPDQFDWIPGIIIKHVSVNEREGNVYLVDYGRGNRKLFSEFDITGLPGFNQWNDIETLEPTAETRKQAVTALVKRGCTDVALLWNVNGRFVLLWDTVGGHYDALLPNMVEDVLENSTSIPFGEPIKSRRLPLCGSKTPLIPGSLFIPSVNIAVVSHEEPNVNVVDLHTSLHIGVRQRIENKCGIVETSGNYTQQAPDDRVTYMQRLNKANSPAARARYVRQQERLRLARADNDRTCWFNNEYYPLGGVLLDWQSKFGGYTLRSVTARALHDNRRGERWYQNGARRRRIEVREIERHRQRRDEIRIARREEQQRAIAEGVRLARQDGGRRLDAQLMGEIPTLSENNDGAI